RPTSPPRPSDPEGRGNFQAAPPLPPSLASSPFVIGRPRLPLSLPLRASVFFVFVSNGLATLILAIEPKHIEPNHLHASNCRGSSTPRLPPRKIPQMDSRALVHRRCCRQLSGSCHSS